jgi:hypothetical protein
MSHTLWASAHAPSQYFPVLLRPLWLGRLSLYYLGFLTLTLASVYINVSIHKIIRFSKMTQKYFVKYALLVTVISSICTPVTHSGSSVSSSLGDHPSFSVAKKSKKKGGRIVKFQDLIKEPNDSASLSTSTRVLRSYL